MNESFYIFQTECGNYVASHPDLVGNELFNQLPEDVQAELYLRLKYKHWYTKRSSTPSTAGNKPSTATLDSSPPVNSADLEDIIAELQMNEPSTQVSQTARVKIRLAKIHARL